MIRRAAKPPIYSRAVERPKTLSTAREYDVADIRFTAMQACFSGGSMACRFGFVIAILAALLAAPTAKAQTGGEVSGIWLTQAGDAKVRVSRCGGGICGVIIWLRDPINPATGKPQVDDKNPNPSLARRPMIGLPLFSGMHPSGPSRWSGQIYNADDGGSYASNISVSGPDTLRVEGCVGVLCGGETWKRSGH
jgi:uncharacterized protein (DUF2147 family)